MANSTDLVYLSRPSSLDANAPLIIMLHGYGSDENDLFSFAPELDDKFLILSLKAPIPIMPFGNCWYNIYFEAPQGKWSDNDEAISSRDKIANFIDYAIETYDVDENNITLLGFSQGCILAMATALTYPKKIHNVVGLSGYINRDIIPSELNKEDFKHLDFYCSHGTVDQVIPVEWARQTPGFLSNFGIKHVYNEFPVGHGVAPQNFFEFKKWLEDKL